MEPKENHLIVERQARYFTYGTLSEKTEKVWFVLHGYGMLASSFIKNFKALDPATNFIVAPEGLSRFYWNGFGGKPVASWMTSSDRLKEIEDYVNYLNLLQQSIAKKTEAFNPTINVLGFSQGTATAARWLASNQFKVDHMIFWAGPLPEDVDWKKALPIFNESKVLFVFGLQDEFIKAEHISSHDEKLKALGMKYEKIDFDGKHLVDEATLLRVDDWINDSL